MREGKQFGLSAVQQSELWRRWKAGQSLHEIGRAFGKEHSSIRCLVARHGRIVPAVRRRSRRVLTAVEREDISRGLASGASLRKIAQLLESGQRLEAHGNPKGALKKYSAVARFGQVTPTGRYFTDGVVTFVMDRVLKDDYQRLASLYQKQGETEQAQLFTLLAGKTAQRQAEFLAWVQQERFGDALTRWNASVVQASGLLLSISVALLLTCALAVIVKSRSLRLSTLRASRGTLALGLCGAIGLLLSSALLYVSYRPYAEIFQQFVRTGNDRQIPEFTEFLSYTQTPLGAHGFQNQANFVFYFWFGATVLCVIALLFVVIRHLVHHRRAAATTQSRRRAFCAPLIPYSAYGSWRGLRLARGFWFLRMPHARFLSVGLFLSECGGSTPLWWCRPD